jgi:immune inhibitor A
VADIGPPFAGEYYYYSGAGDNLDNYMYKAVSVGASQTLTAKVNYEIELNWDYAYLVMSTDGGATWTTIPTNFGDGITGSSGGWVDLTADLPEGDYLLGFNYWTDGNTGGFGFKMDDLVIADLPLDGAEVDAGWTFDGFRVTEGVESAFYNNYYVAEFRQYRGFDAGLANAYNFGFIGVPGLDNFVEHFPYQDGLLISYWDTSFPNNNVTARCGGPSYERCGGLLLPVDAHPEVMYDAFGNVWRGRTQTYDATFGLEATDAITLHKFGEPSYHPSLPAVKTFDDNNDYWNAANPNGSVQVPHTGTQIRVKSVSARESFMQVEVRPSK